MASHFTPEQKNAIAQLLQWPGGSWAESGVGKNRLPIVEVRRVLNLPPVPYGELLGPHCWLAGGCLLRWLCGKANRQETSKGDFDFFFPSPEGLNATADALMACGHQFCAYLAFPRTIREYLRETAHKDRDSGLWDEAGRLAPITPEIIERLRLSALEFRSPMGDKIQLVTHFLSSTPLDTIVQFDISICQFAADADFLTFGPAAWNDLLRNRYRQGDLRWPDNTFKRMFKYARRGFWPYPGTALAVTSAALAWVGVKTGRWLRRLALRPFEQRESE